MRNTPPTEAAPIIHLPTAPSVAYISFYWSGLCLHVASIYRFNFALRGHQEQIYSFFYVTALVFLKTQSCIPHQIFFPPGPISTGPLAIPPLPHSSESSSHLVLLCLRLDKRHVLLMTREAFILPPEACNTFMLSQDDIYSKSTKNCCQSLWHCEGLWHFTI